MARNNGQERRKLPYNKFENNLFDQKYHHEEFYIDTNLNGRKIKLYYQIWYPKVERLRGMIIHLHGMSEYGGRFARNAARFLDQGIAVCLPDHFSYGRSDGLHGYFNNFNMLVVCFKEVFDHLMEKKHFENVPVFLSGVSMGGALALNYCINYQRDARIHGIILACPLVQAPKLVTRGKACKDISFQEEFLSDPMTYHKGVRISTGLALLKASSFVEKNVDRIDIPILIVHGSNDRIIDLSGSQFLFDSVSSVDKTLKIIPEGEHALYVEQPCADQAFKEILEWMTQRL